ncbi:hypothetical protein LJC11_05210 [Bacteroidales bacterium OttesenSCG-928-I21]|nr:hypothetical protein [Bacteroidales bacterium OttesenSCG-928-I21]
MKSRKRLSGIKFGFLILLLLCSGYTAVGGKTDTERRTRVNKEEKADADTLKLACEKGNDFYNKKDYDSALEWYRKSAEHGYADGTIGRIENGNELNLF